jgi:hypothetical protein
MSRTWPEMFQRQVRVRLSVTKAWEGGWTTTVSAPARCTNHDLISTKHRSRPKGRNDSRTSGGYKNLPLPPPLLITGQHARVGHERKTGWGDQS